MIFGGLLGLVVLVLVAWVIVAGPVTVFRIIRYGDTDIDDWSHYPGRTLQAGDAPFRFAHRAEEVRIPDGTLLDYGHEGELDRILEANDSIAFLIIRDDTILYERYFQEHGPKSLSQVFSVSKSFTSALIGMAIDDGYIQGRDQAIADFVPELADAGFDKVTIAHLLTMTSGSNYKENDNPFGEHVILNYTPRLRSRILRVKMRHEPGAVFRYKSGDNALLALALDRALGEETLSTYAERRLWRPLGMAYDGVWTLDREGEDGLEKSWCCLAATARDIAKLGRLYLNRGVWDGEQVLAETWVKQSTSAQIPDAVWPEMFADAGWSNYGYQWWLASEEMEDYFALGKDGQFLYVNSKADTIVLRLGWSTGDLVSSQWIAMFQRIVKELDRVS
jgi:CubicO group peptidase (beta-lactamase class C family)